MQENSGQKHHFSLNRLKSGFDTRNQSKKSATSKLKKRNLKSSYADGGQFSVYAMLEMWSVCARFLNENF